MDPKFVSVTQMRSTFVALHPSLSEDKQSALQQKNIIKILGKDHKESVLCKHQPCRVQINASFLVDLRFVPLKDLQADDGNVSLEF